MISFPFLILKNKGINIQVKKTMKDKMLHLVKKIEGCFSEPLLIFPIINKIKLIIIVNNVSLCFHNIVHKVTGYDNFKNDSDLLISIISCFRPTKGSFLYYSIYCLSI